MPAYVYSESVIKFNNNNNNNNNKISIYITCRTKKCIAYYYELIFHCVFSGVTSVHRS